MGVGDPFLPQRHCYLPIRATPVLTLPFPSPSARTDTQLRARSFPGHCGEHELIPAPQAVGHAGSRLWPAGATAKPRVRAGSTSSSLSVRRGWSALVRSLGGSGRKSWTVLTGPSSCSRYFDCNLSSRGSRGEHCEVL